MASGVMIFAAGFGTRMAPLTNDQPKPLIDVGGQTLLDRTLELARPFGPVVINAHYLGNQIIDFGARHGVQVSFEPEILDTGGGLLAARSLFPASTVFTMNSDAIWSGPNPFQVLLDHWAPHMKALLLCAPPANTLAHAGEGDFTIAADGKITRGPGHTYLGAQIINMAAFNQREVSAFSLNEIWNDLMATGEIFGCQYEGQWCDVGRPENILVAEKMLEG